MEGLRVLTGTTGSLVLKNDLGSKGEKGGGMGRFWAL